MGSVRLYRTLTPPFYTTLPVLAEAMYALGARSGWYGQGQLWKMILHGDLLLEHPSRAELVRMPGLMDKYSDRPMDFADASLVALAERLSLDRVFTVDRRDFATYACAAKGVHGHRPRVALMPGSLTEKQDAPFPCKERGRLYLLLCRVGLSAANALSGGLTRVQPAAQEQAAGS